MGILDAIIGAAVRSNALESLRVWLDRYKIELNKPGSDGLPILHALANSPINTKSWKNGDIVTFLLERGANPSIKYNGRDVLEIAMANENINFLKPLLTWGAGRGDERYLKALDDKFESKYIKSLLDTDKIRVFKGNGDPISFEGYKNRELFEEKQKEIMERVETAEKALLTNTKLPEVNIDLITKFLQFGNHRSHRKHQRPPRKHRRSPRKHRRSPRRSRNKST